MDNIVSCDCEVIHRDVVDNVMKLMLNSDIINRLSNLYKIYSDPTRVKILFALSCEELCVCDLAVVLNMTKSAISHQLNYLRTANLVKNRKSGKIVFYSLVDECVKEIIDIGFIHINEKNCKEDL
ncbi:MAG: metalloregulator ArsR/SmtB family transcription factor [Bacilli bacterium]|nr:metalloregulator ArsR/SmtB family transcription factor [Bacilli bacterium]